MKKDVFEQLRELLRNFQGRDLNRKNTLEFERSYLGNTNGITDNRMEQEDVFSKEQQVEKLFVEIKDFLEVNKKTVAVCEITDEEWKLFLGKAYDCFDEYQLSSGFNNLMMSGIQYVLWSGFVNDMKGITLQKMLENFEIPMLPNGVAVGMVEAIRRDVYMATRKDNVVDFQEYKKVSRK